MCLIRLRFADFICRCDIIAMGIINAANAIGLKKPIVIRLKGTNVEEAKKLIEVCTNISFFSKKMLFSMVLLNVFREVALI